LSISPPGVLLGARSPRVEQHPPYELTFGPAAVELARRAGQQMDPWQADSLDVMLGLRHDDKWASFEFAEWVSRQNGKGGIGEARVLVGFLGPLNERLILWSAHEYKTAMEAHRRIGWLLHNLGERQGKNMIVIPAPILGTPADILIKVNNTNGEEAYERLDTGQRVRFLARTKGSGRGFSGDVNLIDESFAYTLEHQSALMPTLSARPNPQIVYLSSPPLDALTGEVMFQLRRRSLAGGDDSLGYRDWGLDGDLANLDGINLGDERLWAATNPALGIRITAETIRREWRSMSAIDFARERLGIWPAELSESFQLIPGGAWEAAGDPGAQLDGRPAFGVYVPPDRSYSAIAAAGARTGGGRMIEITGNHTIGDDHRPGTGWIVPRLLELEKHQPVVAVIDDKAVADAAEAAGLTVHRAVVGDVVTGCQLLFDGVAGADEASRDVHHLGQKPLTDAAAGAVKRNVGGSWAWDRHNVSVDIGPLAAASLALFGYSTARVHRLSGAFFGSWR
jgi:hypothetical protein